MKNKFILILAVLFSLPAFFINAQNYEDSVVSRPVTGIYALEFGHKTVLATYLSPLHYSGTNYAIKGIWKKAMPFNPVHAIMHFDADADFCNLLNPAHTARMVGINASFIWGMSWRTKLPHDFQISAGGQFDIYGGAYYLLRNGNNPVQAMAEFSLDITAGISKPFRIGKLYAMIEDNVSIPSIGAFFNAEYGETYYEIYLGNHKGLIHPGWWGNNFCVSNLLALTFDFGRTALTLGYDFSTRTQWANNLNTKIFTHSFMIGIIPGGIGLRKSKVKPVSSVIYAGY